MLSLRASNEGLARARVASTIIFPFSFSLTAAETTIVG